MYNSAQNLTFRKGDPFSHHRHDSRATIPDTLRHASTWFTSNAIARECTPNPPNLTSTLNHRTLSCSELISVISTVSRLLAPEKLPLSAFPRPQASARPCKPHQPMPPIQQS